MNRTLSGIVICLVVVAAALILLAVGVHLFGLRPKPLVVDEYHAALISRVNAAENATWTARFNKFAVRASDQAAFYPNTDHLHSIFPSILEIDEYAKNVLLSENIARHLLRLLVIQSVPEHFDARERWPHCWSIRHVADQGECGSCWAMAVIATMSDRICIQSNGTHQPLLSAQQLVSCCDYCGTCMGTMEPLGSFYYWLTEGIVTGGLTTSTDGCWPYEMKTDCGYPCTPRHYVTAPRVSCRTTCKKERFGRLFDEDKYYAAYIYRLGQFKNVEHRPSVWSKYKSLINSSSMEDLLKRELMAFGPVIMCFDVMEEFQHYVTGVYQPITEQDGSYLYGHCVKIIGWGSTPTGVKYLLAINSWSQNWGESGAVFSKVKMSHLGNSKITDRCSFRIRIDPLLTRKSDMYAGVPKTNS